MELFNKVEEFDVGMILFLRSIAWEGYQRLRTDMEL